MAAKLKFLHQQVIVLTGACSAVGLCTAQLAAQRGAKLVLVARSTRVLDSLVSIIGSTGGEAVALAADVAVREEIAAAAQAAIARFGRIDTWVNNAGISIYGRLDEVTEAESRHLFDVNFWGVVNGSLVALPHLLCTGGSLINIGSELPEGALPLQAMYASSKQAVTGFTAALRAEVEQAGRAPLSVTLIEPAAGSSPPYVNSGAGEGRDVPVPVIDPMEVAEAILAAATQGGCDIGLTQPSSRTGRAAAAAMLPAARPSAKQA
jgi:NADP-dependent 3-hydroxy acid dehydrogenase YdfG